MPFTEKQNKCMLTQRNMIKAKQVNQNPDKDQDDVSRDIKKVSVTVSNFLKYWIHVMERSGLKFKKERKKERMHFFRRSFGFWLLEN